MDTSRRTRIFQALLMVTLLVSVALLVRVAQGKRAAEQSWSELYDLSLSPHPGMYVPVYSALTGEGDPVIIGDASTGSRQVLFFFTTRCPYCRASIPTWKSLAQIAAVRPDVAVYGVAIDSTHLIRQYVADHGLTYGVVEMNDRRFARLFRVVNVPLVMVLEPSGQVSYTRIGEFSAPSLIDSVLAVLDEPPAPPDQSIPRGPTSASESTARESSPGPSGELRLP